jgi:hypothetical protein
MSKPAGLDNLATEVTRIKEDHGLNTPDDEKKGFQDDMELAHRVSRGGEQSTQSPKEDVQGGVKEVEAITLSWTRTDLIIAYVW